VGLDLLVAAGGVLGLDQLSKTLVLSRLNAGQWAPIGSGPRIRAVPNAAAGPGLRLSRGGLLSLWLCATAGTILVAHSAPSLQGQAVQLGLGAAIGGATSNLLDRIRRGAVVDFIDLRVWPSFNVADVAIVLGVTGALFSMR
jgi:signal peptidase II